MGSQALTGVHQIASPPQGRERDIMRVGVLLGTLLIFTLIGCSNGSKVIKPSVAPKPLLVDEYAVLDDAKGGPEIADGVIRQRLDQARAHYLHALKAVEADREKVAAQHFEAAIAILNNMMTHPDINALPEYSRLSRSVIRDYEGKITSIENLDSSSSFFVLRDKMFDEIELLPVSFRPAAEVELDVATIDSLVIGLPENEAVQQTLDYFTNGRGRKYMALWLQRSGRYFPLYERILEEEGAPDELKYLSMIESGLSARATSHAAAVGLWQFIASTGRAYGMYADWYRDERRDPEKATRAAARYLLDLYDQMGDWHLALGSYNCGPGRMRKALRRADSTDYWEARKHLPRETARYVPLYIAAAKIARDPEAYGFTDIVFDRPFEFDVVPVYAPYQLSTIAEVAGVGIDVLQDLNPELLQDQVPPGEAFYELRVPTGLGQRLATILDTLTVAGSSSMSWTRHKVQRGETVTKIANRYGVGVSEVLEANGMTARSTLLRGSTLKIPKAGVSEPITPEMIAERKAQAEQDRLASIAAKRAEGDEVASTNEEIVTAESSTQKEPVSQEIESAEQIIADVPTAERKALQPRDVPSAAADDQSNQQSDHSRSIFINTDSVPSEEKPSEVAASSTITPVDTSVDRIEIVEATSITDNSTRVERVAVEENPAASNEVVTSRQQEELVVSESPEPSNEVVDSDPRPGNSAISALTTAINAPVGANRIPSTPPTTRRYKVRRGETLTDIAAKFQVSVRALQEANPRLGSNGVAPGQVIVVR